VSTVGGTIAIDDAGKIGVLVIDTNLHMVTAVADFAVERQH
jgi:hypothetical protein